MSLVTNTIAKKLIDYIDTLIKEQNILDVSKIHVLLDDSDITENHPDYKILFDAGMYEKAFALPKKPTPFAEPMIKLLWRMGVKVTIYTGRVDTVRLEKTCEAITAASEVPGLFNKCLSLRDEENKVLRLDQLIKEDIMPKDGSNHAILYCAFSHRIEQFKEADLRDYCATTHGLLMSER